MVVHHLKVNAACQVENFLYLQKSEKMKKIIIFLGILGNTTFTYYSSKF